MPTIYIDNKAFDVAEGDNVLHAVLGLGLDLPYFCWHPAMGSVGACRQCALVQYRDEDDKQGRIVMGCMTPVSDGARFSMQGPDASEFRKNIIESLMLNHPHDCPVCAEGGECHLQDMTVMVGHRNRRYRGKKNTHRNQYLGPLVHHEMNRCISCYRCTRYYNDYAGGTDLAAQAAHDHVYFGRQEDGVLESEFAGNLVEVCPTGVFTDKPLVNDYTRKWDLQSAPSVCVGCAAGCNTSPGERYGELKRIHNRFNSQVNGYFLCDRGRYGGDFVNDAKRPSYAGLRDESGRYSAIQSEQAIAQTAQWCSNLDSDNSDSKVVAIGSPRASLESNYLLRRMVGAQNYCDGIADFEAGLLNQIGRILSDGSVKTPSMKQVESADAVLILGEDVTNTMPRLALALRQSVRNLANELATDMRIPLWQDEAVRNLAQDRLSPMFIVAMAASPLDDVAAKTIHLSPADIARLGYAIASEIDPNLDNVSGLDETASQHAKEIANTLKAARRPLVVSGTGAQNSAVIQAAAAIARALQQSEAMLSYCLPECNSMGSALMHDNAQLSLHDLCLKAADGKLDTLLVLENDLYRRGPAKQIDALLNDIKNLVVFDALDSPTVSKSALILPAATFAECEGTLVSAEGRAQRHFPVFLPAEQRQASWQWILKIGQALGVEGFDQLVHFDDITTACATDNIRLDKITEASPAAEFRDRGMKVPRQTHRYSGRTAMRADISVHEPKQPVDEDTPLSFSMEGANSGKSGAIVPYVWSPGWNSNQSLHKFQNKAGSTLKGGTPGVRLIEPANTEQTVKPDIPAAFQTQDKLWQLLPLHRIFGSEELSARSPAIRELCDRPFISLSPKDAALLQLQDSDYVVALIEESEITLSVRISATIPDGCAGYAVGLPGADWLAPETLAGLSKADTPPATESPTTENAGHDV